MKDRTLTRRDFLKAAGAGSAGAAMLGTAGCSPMLTNLTHVSDEYLPSGGSRMNVILVIIDSLRRDHLGVYGNDWIKTPNLDALAKESLLFTRALPDAMPTIPARRAIHTGMRTWPTGPEARFGWSPIPSGRTSLPRPCGLGCLPGTGEPCRLLRG